MLRFGLQSPDSLIYHCGSQNPDFRGAAAQHPFGERRPGGNRRSASADFVADLFGYAIHEPNRQTQNVAACRIRRFDRDGRRSQLANVSRILKMVQQTFGIHSGMFQ